MWLRPTWRQVRSWSYPSVEVRVDFVQFDHTCAHQHTHTHTHTRTFTRLPPSLRWYWAVTVAWLSMIVFAIGCDVALDELGDGPPTRIECVWLGIERSVRLIFRFYRASIAGKLYTVVYVLEDVAPVASYAVLIWYTATTPSREMLGIAPALGMGGGGFNLLFSVRPSSSVPLFVSLSRQWSGIRGCAERSGEAATGTWCFCAPFGCFRWWPACYSGGCPSLPRLGAAPRPTAGTVWASIACWVLLSSACPLSIVVPLCALIVASLYRYRMQRASSRTVFHLSAGTGGDGDSGRLHRRVVLPQLGPAGGGAALPCDLRCPSCPGLRIGCVIGCMPGWMLNSALNPVIASFFFFFFFFFFSGCAGALVDQAPAASSGTGAGRKRDHLLHRKSVAVHITIYLSFPPRCWLRSHADAVVSCPYGSEIWGIENKNSSRCHAGRRCERRTSTRCCWCRFCSTCPLCSSLPFC